MTAHKYRSESRSSTLAEFVIKRLSKLQREYLTGTSAAKAACAQLRDMNPEDDQQVLLAWETIFSAPPTELIGKGDQISREERVIVTALHLWATHQQSKSKPMHEAGIGLGAAIRGLANPSDADSREKPVMRRYHALITSTDMTEATQHLRPLIKQFRSNGLTLDYVQLTKDLYALTDERFRTSARLRWARDLSRPRADNESDSSIANA